MAPALPKTSPAVTTSSSRGFNFGMGISMAMDIDTGGLGDVAMMLDWAAAEGWNPGLDDAAPFFAADPGGFLVGRIDGEAVASISVVRPDAFHAFLGFYICKPEFRGQGHGLAIWESGIELAGARTIGLDGVVAQQENYKKSGFTFAWRNVRYTGQFAVTGLPFHGVRPIRPRDEADVIAIDSKCSGFHRPDFARAWFGHAGTRSTFVHETVGVIDGVCTVRACRTGHKVGPLYAADLASARNLLHAAVHAAGAGTVYLDVPAINSAGLRLAAEMGMYPEFETARMYRGATPRIDTSLVFGVTTFELG